MSLALLSLARFFRASNDFTLASALALTGSNVALTLKTRAGTADGKSGQPCGRSEARQKSLLRQECQLGIVLPLLVFPKYLGRTKHPGPPLETLSPAWHFLRPASADEKKRFYVNGTHTRLLYHRSTSATTEPNSARPSSVMC